MSTMAPIRPRILLCAAVVAFLSSCVGTGTRDERAAEQASQRSRRVIAAALDHVQDRYVRAVDMGELVSLGLAGVARTDSSIEFRRDGAELAVLRRGNAEARLPVDPAGGGKGWATAAWQAIEAARARSSAIAELDADQASRIFLEAMAKGLDPYSRYTTPEAAREERVQREGFGGVGIVIDAEGGEVRVVTVMEDTPASRAGLRGEDRILSIDGQSTAGLTAREVVRRLRGPVGAPVDVEVGRPPDGARLRVSLVRAHIVPQTVSYRRAGDAAHIRVSGFNPRTTEALADAVRRAEREIGPRFAGVILDLRNNFGGYLDQSIYVSDLFLPEGTIVSTRGRYRSVSQESWARRGDIGERLPLVVLINGNSASASEIVAAALQDNGRAVVVGTTSFGKGSVQSILPLPNEGELVLTSARFHAPSGYALAELGVLPHLCTSGGRDAPTVILDNLRAGRYADHAAATRWRSVSPEDGEGRRKLRAAACPSDTAERDSDLELARSLLADRGLHALALGSTPAVAQVSAR
ncbi:MAG: S41 family peptidase [Alphaproteobacteria bacterium]|nr:S41 family peptidase [Alphaproteobacteria bacterium]